MKMNRKKKVTLDEGEALVVATVGEWNHMIMVYRTLADRARENNGEESPDLWDDFADHIASWVEDTRYDYSYED